MTVKQMFAIYISVEFLFTEGFFAYSSRRIA